MSDDTEGNLFAIGFCLGVIFSALVWASNHISIAWVW